MATIKGIEQAVSAYGYTQQFIERADFDNAEIIRHVADKGINKIELVGAQAFGNYPTPTAVEIDAVLRASDEYGVYIYSYGGYVDLGRVTGARMSESDILSDMRLDMMTARALGAQSLRATGFSPNLVPRVADLADQYGITVGFEIHAPHTPTDEATTGFKEVIDRYGITSFGLVPDFGMFIERPTEIAIQRYIGLGARRDLLDYVIAHRWDGSTEEEMCERVAAMGGGLGEKIAISEWFGYLSFAPADIEGFANMVPYTKYVHGKFYHVDMDSHGNLSEPTIPYTAALKTLVQGGFKGVLVSEYEGHAFYLDDADEQIDRHLAMTAAMLTNS